MQPVHDYSPAEFRNNVIGLAKLGKVFKLPTVLTTSLGQGPNGPFIPEVVSMFPDVPVIDRPGIISAWDDPKFVAAIEKTGRKNLIMAGVTIDVCLASPPCKRSRRATMCTAWSMPPARLRLQCRCQNERSWDHTHQLDYGCGRAAAELEPADREGLGAGLPRPLSQLRPFDGQFRVRYRECGPEGVLAESRIIPDDRRSSISLSRSGSLLDQSPERDNQSSHASIAVSKRLAATALPAR